MICVEVRFCRCHFNQRNAISVRRSLVIYCNGRVGTVLASSNGEHSVLRVIAMRLFTIVRLGHCADRIDIFIWYFGLVTDM